MPGLETDANGSNMRREGKAGIQVWGTEQPGGVTAEMTKKGRSVGLENKSEVGFGDAMFARSRGQPSGEVEQASEKPGRDRDRGGGYESHHHQIDGNDSHPSSELRW